MAEKAGAFARPGAGPDPGLGAEDGRQEPGIAWYVAPGAEGMIPGADLIARVDGVDGTIPAAAPIYLWRGSVAATLAAREVALPWRVERHVLATTPGGASLFAIPQAAYAAAAAAEDIAGWAYRHSTGWRRWQPKRGTRRAVIASDGSERFLNLHTDRAPTVTTIIPSDGTERMLTLHGTPPFTHVTFACVSDGTERVTSLHVTGVTTFACVSDGTERVTSLHTP